MKLSVLVALIIAVAFKLAQLNEERAKYGWLITVHADAHPGSVGPRPCPRTSCTEATLADWGAVPAPLIRNIALAAACIHRK